MDIASVFEWFAQESKSIAEQANEPKQRETFTELALLWATADSEGGPIREMMIPPKDQK
jgi:hypothetical protein